MNLKCSFLIFLFSICAQAAGPYYYDQEFQGQLQINTKDGNLEAVHQSWSQYMAQLGQFMTARRMRLDNLTNQQLYPRVDSRVQNYFDINPDAYDWFSELEKAYKNERSVNPSYDSPYSANLKSLIGFKNLNNFIGALVWTKAQQNPDYKRVLAQAMSEQAYLGRLMGVVADTVPGAEMEKVVGRDLVAQLTSKTGAFAELDRVNLASYPVSKNVPRQLQFHNKAWELLKGQKALHVMETKACRAL